MIFEKNKDKQTSHNIETGKLGEKIAEKYLKKHGHKIIARNAREGYSEIDIISVKNDTLIFTEVKTRTLPNNGSSLLSRPANAVNKSKSSYLVRGANRFCAENADKYGNFYKRFDIIEVYLKNVGKKTVCIELKHFENAVKGRYNI